MSRILAIDPGNTESAFIVIDHATRRPLQFGKIDNVELRDRLWTSAPSQIVADMAAIEMIASYGMSVGADIFETCVWIGRFFTAYECATGHEPDLIKRHPVKMHHCHSAAAKDGNIAQALADRFAPGQPNRGKGTKADPGWFYGFAADVWQAYALAVYVADQIPTDAVLVPGPSTLPPGTSTVPQSPVAAAGSTPDAATASPAQGVLL